MRGIILDGWHKGQIVNLPSPAPPTLTLLKPRRITSCLYDEESEIEMEPKPPEQSEYSVAFRSMDGKFALYSERGDSEALIRDKKWVVKKPYELKETVYFDCRDERAFQ